MTRSTLQLHTEKLLQAVDTFDNTVTLEDVIDALYLFVWSGQCVIGILPQMVDTWALKNIKTTLLKCLVMYLKCNNDISMSIYF